MGEIRKYKIKEYKTSECVKRKMTDIFDPNEPGVLVG